MNSARRKNPRTPARLVQALAIIMANTRRGQRKVDLVTLSKHIEVARDILGSLNAVAERVGLSPEMVRQFASVSKLSPAIKRLVAGRRIDNVDIAYRLTRFSSEDQAVTAQWVVDGRLDADDVRALVTYRKAEPNLPIDEVISRLLATKDTVQHVVEFLVSGSRGAEQTVCRRLADLVGADNVGKPSRSGSVVRVALTQAGFRKLEEEAKQRGLTKRQLVDIVSKGGQ